MIRVVVYSKPNCAQCAMTYRALDHARIRYKVIDLTTDPDALERVTRLGHKQAPVVVVDGAQHWSGFQPDRIKQLTKEHQ